MSMGPLSDALTRRRWVDFGAMCSALCRCRLTRP